MLLRNSLWHLGGSAVPALVALATVPVLIGGLGLEGFGRLEPGYHADLVIMDDDFEIWKTLVGGVVK